jgi:AMP nucleosidase
MFASTAPALNALNIPLRDVFDAPELTNTDDEIANGTFVPPERRTPTRYRHISPRRGSITRCSGSATTPAPRSRHFQNFVIFTNYQFYIDEFCRVAKRLYGGMATRALRRAFVEPGNVTTENVRLGGKVTSARRSSIAPAADAGLSPRRPARSRGITMVNIGVGPSNAKTITDHIAVLRPHAWIMLGHCAGLQEFSQELGDYVLAHAYVREDHVLDADLPLSVPIPALAEDAGGAWPRPWPT